MRLGQHRRAFVLVSVMLVVLVLGMLLRVAILRMPSATGSARQSVMQAQAARAARSGLSFALTKLREKNSWRGGESRRILVDQPGVLQVVEEQGNVLGTLTDSDGTVSEFRFRFNYQNGAASDDPDSLPDPSGEMFFDLPYVSVNNLESNEAAVVPRADRTTFRVGRPDEGHLVPEVSVSLAVEGRVLGSRGQALARHVCESVYVLADKDQGEDAVIMAGGGLDLTLQTQNGWVQLGAKKMEKGATDIARIRSKKGLTVSQPDGQVPKVRLQQGRHAEFAYQSGEGNNVDDLLRAGPAGRLTAVEEDSEQDFYSLPASSVKKASPTKSAVIKAGTYVYTGVDPGRKILYFEMTGQEYLESRPPLSSGLAVSSDLSNVRQDSLGNLGDKLKVGPALIPVGDTSIPGFRWTVQDVDLLVQPSGSNPEVRGLSIMPANPAPFTHSDSWDSASSDQATPDRLSVNLTNTTLTSPGDLTIYGGVTGKSGTVTSEGSVKVLAGRTLKMEQGKKKDEEPEEPEEPENPEEPETAEEKADRNTALQLNIYAQRDLEISTYSPSLGRGRGGYRNLTFKGLLYSWGDVSIRAADPTQKVRNGNLVLKGSLVAYGSDPQSEAPGQGIGGLEGSRGRVSMQARNAVLEWDPSFFNLAALQGGSSSIFFRRYSVGFPPP